MTTTVSVAAGAAAVAAAVTAMSRPKYTRVVDKFTSSEEVDDALLAVSARAAAWAQVDLDAKINILKDVKRRAIKCSMQMGRANAVVRPPCNLTHCNERREVTGFGTRDSSSPTFQSRAKTYGVLLTSTITIHVDALITMLQRRRDGTMPAAGDLQCRQTADGRSVLHVTGGTRKPASPFLRSMDGFVYLKPGQEPSQGREVRAGHDAAAAGTCLVLGAGNQGFLGLYDTLHVMFHFGHTACLKYHDTQAETAPFMDYMLEPLIEAGFLKTFHCSLELTRHALQHEAVCRVHITGSHRTHDVIAWGTGEEAEKRKAAGELLLKAPMTSELGNVTPVVIVPGAWEAADVRKAAKLVAINMSDNAGCNCLAPKAIVLAEEWPQAAEFEAALKEELAALPAFPAWYPGAAELHKQFVEQHPGCELITATAVPGQDSFGKPALPWAVHSVTVSSAAEAAAVPGLADEFFAPVTTITRLSAAACPAPTADVELSPTPSTDAGSPSTAASSGEHPSRHNLTASFLRAVPGFLEEGLWGNLVASVFAPPAVEAAAPDELQQCLDDVRYGSVMLNSPTFFAYTHAEGVWGGFQAPDTSMLHPRSGVGLVANTLCLDGVEKQVLREKWSSPVPPTSIPLPSFVLKGVTGLLCGGMTGLWQAATP